MSIAPGAAVVADANVLLSAAVGKAALRPFTEFSLEVHAARFNASEVEEYLPQLSEKYGLPGDLVELEWMLLPVVVHPEAAYADQLDRARRILAGRDPDDAHPLALAFALGLPIWSNDRDLQGHGVECYPTARLLSELQRSDEPKAGG